MRGDQRRPIRVPPQSSNQCQHLIRRLRIKVACARLQSNSAAQFGQRTGPRRHALLLAPDSGAGDDPHAAHCRHSQQVIGAVAGLDP